MELLGYISMISVGVILGLIGGGGSILTLPILVYLFDTSPSLGTGYSLFIVGATAMIGAVSYAKQQLIDYKVGFIFAAPAFAGVFLARRFLVPALPDTILETSLFVLSKDGFIMVVFALLMVAASWSMIRDRRPDAPSDGKSELPMRRILIVALEGLVVGGITGFVGAGGGFLLIPALVLLAKLPVKRAIGTSLMIITVKSLFGFLGDVGSGQHIAWGFLFTVTGLAIIGVILGSYLVRFISAAKLKPIFGWFVLLMGGAILGLQLLS